MSLKDKFASTKYSSYMYDIAPNSSCIEMDNEFGKGLVYVHNVFDGILALFINILSKEWPTASSQEKKNLIFLNYCVKGRCEINLDNGLTTCISDGELSISKNVAIKQFFYPLKHYEGFELVFNVDILKDKEYLLKDVFDIDITKSLEHYTNSKIPFIVALSPKLKQFVKKIYENNNKESLFEIRMNVLYLLNLLSKKEFIDDNKKRVYLTSSQIHIAKATEEIITEDLQKKITVADLSKVFNVSETTLKTYFKGLYGKSISMYLQEMRMNTAAKQITETTDLISNIAGMVGYENQSKFASVFKNYFECSPVEYRRLNQTESRFKQD